MQAAEKLKLLFSGNRALLIQVIPGEIIGKPDFSVAAICAAERLPQFPDVPTFKELGLDGLENEIMWRGFAVVRQELLMT